MAFKKQPDFHGSVGQPAYFTSSEANEMNVINIQINDAEYLRTDDSGVELKLSGIEIVDINWSRTWNCSKILESQLLMQRIL